MSDKSGIRLRDRKGGDPSEWPEDLRVREFPRTPTAYAHQTDEAERAADAALAEGWEEAMSCIYCGRPSAGSDLCARCEEREREAEREAPFRMTEEEIEAQDAADSTHDPEHPANTGL